MTRLVCRNLSILSTLVISSFVVLACGSNGTPGATGGASSIGGSAASGGAGQAGGNANAGGTTNSGGSLTNSGGSNVGGGPPAGGGNSGGAPNSGGGSGDSGGGSGDSGGSDNGSGGNGSGGAPTNNNPIGGTGKYDCSAATGEVPVLKLTKLTGDLNLPVDAAHPPDDDRLFVITLAGQIRIYKDGALVSTPFLDITSKVAVGGSPGDERGLLGIAFHPDYATNGLFYVHYNLKSSSAGDSQIEEYKVSDNPDVADATSARTVLTVAQPGMNQFNHKGGAINFGPNKLLFIGLGDGGGSGDQHTPPNGQSTATLLGKILRINPLKDGDKAYTTPADNLVMDVNGAKPEIWDYGLRNPFRSSFDACTGDLYIGDVGQNDKEEIDIEKVGEGRQNYGWNTMEGLQCYPANVTNCDKTGLTLPLIEVDDSEGTSITGGSVYRGKEIPGIRGVYFYADYVSNKVWWTKFDRTAGTVSTPTSITQDLNPKTIVAIRNGNDGELYFVSLGLSFGGNPSTSMGAVYKLEADE
jgi:glucose/arabinose dehydrogenase